MLTVHQAEAGMKLLRFLARRLGNDVPQSVLHRWIRTGQVRVNKGRAKPFMVLRHQDIVRMPPFARPEIAPHGPEEALFPRAGQQLGKEVRILAVSNDMLALVKAPGLPTQPGSGWSDSVATRLARSFAALPYVPAPAHRLDKDASGILLAGTTHAAQQQLHAWFAGAANGAAPLRKEYLAWVQGRWPHSGPLLLHDRLEKKKHPAGGGEKVRTAGQTRGKEALAAADAASVRLHPSLGFVSLLRLQLHTGRTHQLRVQLAGRGFPVIGDVKYGGPRWQPLLLHAWRITLPTGETFAELPAWEEEMAVPATF